MNLFGRNTGIFSMGKGSKGRPPFEAFYIYILALLTGFLLADLGILYVRPSMLPTQPPPVKQSRPIQQSFTSEDVYRRIKDRNIFNADGKIPPAYTSEGGPSVGPD